MHLLQKLEKQHWHLHQSQSLRKHQLDQRLQRHRNLSRLRQLHQTLGPHRLEQLQQEQHRFQLGLLRLNPNQQQLMIHLVLLRPRRLTLSQLKQLHQRARHRQEHRQQERHRLAQLQLVQVSQQMESAWRMGLLGKVE